MKVIDFIAIPIGILALALSLFGYDFPQLISIAGIIWIFYLCYAIVLWIVRPKFDWHLIRGHFLLKVISFVLLTPSFCAFLCLRFFPNYSSKNFIHDDELCTNFRMKIDTLGSSNQAFLFDSVYAKIHNLDVINDSIIVQKSKLSDWEISKHSEPSLFWSVFYHFVDPGNQHMAKTQSGRGFTAIIAILGIFLLNGLLVSSIIGWIDSRKEKWIKGEIRYGWLSFIGKKIAVVIGANDYAPTIIKNLLGGYGEKRIHYVVLLTNEDVEKVRDHISSYLTKEEGKRLIIYSGQLDSIEEIYKLHLKKATEIYVLGEYSNDDISQSYHDTQNMRCVHNIASYLTDKCVERKIVCRVSFEYQTTYSVFQFSDLPENIRQHLVFIPFNPYENWAQRVFVYGQYTETVKKILPTIRRMDLQPIWINRILHPLLNCLQSMMPKNNEESRTINYIPLDGKGISSSSDKNVHLIIVGMSKMGIAMAIQAAQVAHYPNFSSGKKTKDNKIEREPSLKRTRITFIDENADNEMNFFMGRFQNLFDLSRFRYIDASNIENNLQPEWKDPLEQMDCEYKLHGENFLDIEWEFVKGGIQSPGVMKFLKEVARNADCKKKHSSLLTIAICQPMSHEAIASALYMPNEVYDYAQQILVYQKEASDIVYNLCRDEKTQQFKRYSKLRPFGMQYADFTMNKNNYFRSQLCNYVYDLIFDDKIDNELIPTKISNLKISDKNGEMMAVRKSWKKLSIFNKWSNKYLANSFETKLRSIGACSYDMLLHYDKICALLETNKPYMAECEHNRWNIQQLLMGFRAYKDKELDQFMNLRDKAKSSDEAEAYFKEYKERMKKSPDKVHLNICSVSLLHDLDEKAEGYDEIFNSSIPAILLCIEKFYKYSNNS